MRRNLFLGACVAGLIAVTTAGADVLPGSSPAVVTGIVQGPDGARLPGVSITVTEGDRVVARVVSGEQGAFRVSGLAAGRYRLAAELQGFRTTIAEIDAGTRPETVVQLHLDLQPVSELVTVVGSAARATIETPRVRESAARDVGEALAGLAGVWKVRRGAIASDVVVRGYQGDNVTVLIDGARLYGACPNNMDHTAFHVDFAEVDRIEIGKGPFDLKNQGGLGGAVNIVTKRPTEGAHVTPQLFAGSYGYLNPTVTASYGNGRFAILGGYSYRVADAYTDGEGRSFLHTANYKTTALDDRAFDVNTAWGRIDASPGSGHALHATYTRQRAGVVLYPYLQMDAVYDNADRVNLGYDMAHGFGPVRSLRVQGYLTGVEHWMTDAWRVSSNGMSAGYSMATMAKAGTLGGKIEAAVPGGTVGVDVYRRSWEAETQLAMMKYQPQFTIPDVAITSVGVYGEFSRAFGDALKVEAGARLDRTRNEADAARANTSLYRAYHGIAATSALDTYPSGKVRATYKVASSLTVSGGVGRTVRVPDPQERYFGLRRSGTDWVGNPFLEPTTNTGVELAAAYRAGRLFVNATVHRDALDNAIAVYQQPKVMAVTGITNPSARSYTNVDATMTGAEVEAVFPVTDRLFLAGDVSLVRGRQTARPDAGIRSEWLSEMPPTRSRLALRYEWRGSRRSGFAEVETVYSAGQTNVNSDLRESPTSPYAITNARVGGSLGRLRLAVGVANLFDRAYVEHLSYQRDPFRSGARIFEPGRNVYTNVSLVF